MDETKGRRGSEYLLGEGVRMGKRNLFEIVEREKREKNENKKLIYIYILL